MLTNDLHGPFSSRKDGNIVTCSRITAKQHNKMFPETFKVGNWQCNIRIFIHIWRHVKSEFCETGHNQSSKYCDWNPLTVVTFYCDWPITDQGGGRSVQREGWPDVSFRANGAWAHGFMFTHDVHRLGIQDLSLWHLQMKHCLFDCLMLGTLVRRQISQLAFLWRGLLLQAEPLHWNLPNNQLCNLI